MSGYTMHAISGASHGASMARFDWMVFMMGVIVGAMVVGALLVWLDQ